MEERPQRWQRMRSSLSEIFTALRSVVSKVKSCGGAATVQINNLGLNISLDDEMT
jgi:hypothetical protein